MAEWSDWQEDVEKTRRIVAEYEAAVALMEQELELRRENLAATHLILEDARDRLRHLERMTVKYQEECHEESC
jgi:hypothetical protein